ncbi:MAG: DUF309 domain-containing protein [Chloroflexi bacterium]|nr:DUF309 domain-containing protein [Chloroflexota bacterium]
MSHPLIVIAGAPSWAADIEAKLPDHDAAALVYTDKNGYIARLADDNAALILVDGADAEWRFWATTPKTSPATRRIPVVLVTDDPAIRNAGLSGGANLVVAPADLLARLPDLIGELARVPDPAAQAQLDAQCGEPLPPDGQQALSQFNAGEYYKQHDLFEALWVAETGPVRDLYRAVLQVGVAYYQVQRGNQRGALKMLLRSVQWLTLLPDACQGVDVAQLRADAAAVRAELERVGPDGMADFDQGLLKPVRTIDAPN